MLGDRQGAVLPEHRYPFGDRFRFVASAAVLRLLFTCVHSNWQKSMKIACGDGIFALWLSLSYGQCGKRADLPEPMSFSLAYGIEGANTLKIIVSWFVDDKNLIVLAKTQKLGRGAS